MKNELGTQIKILRTQKKMTLKDLSLQTQLSVGFLSQLERGISTIAIDALEKIAKALEVEMATFFEKKVLEEDALIIRRHEMQVSTITNGQFIHYDLAMKDLGSALVPRLIEILPSDHVEHIQGYGHKGEEFVYVLEGILTLEIDGRYYELYPGDSSHYVSTRSHNWSNPTNKIVKLLVVNSVRTTPIYQEK